MSFLEKNFALFERDEKGNILPQVTTIAIDSTPQVKVMPMMRGEIKRIFDEKKEDMDAEIIEKYCLEPKFSKEEILKMKKYVSDAIVAAIFKVSGLREPKEYEKIEAELAKK